LPPFSPFPSLSVPPYLPDKLQTFLKQLKATSHISKGIKISPHSGILFDHVVPLSNSIVINNALPVELELKRIKVRGGEREGKPGEGVLK
jgi:hypothetical protein